MERRRTRDGGRRDRREGGGGVREMDKGTEGEMMEGRRARDGDRQDQREEGGGREREGGWWERG